MSPYLGAVPGGYGEGGVLLGVRVPAARRVAADFTDLDVDALDELLASPVHEERFVALVLLVRRYRRGDAAERERIFELYLARTDRIDNWDLVDSSAPQIVGAHLLERPRAVLDRLAASPSLWERRIAVVATFTFIRAGQLDDTLRLAERLLDDEHDLIHKAVGWMLREAGKRDEARLVAFLERHGAVMPRTMLRYAIERLDPATRGRLMALGRPR
jgi:3-methyladenine DNA glycosylase AlkD